MAEFIDDARRDEDILTLPLDEFYTRLRENPELSNSTSTSRVNVLISACAIKKWEYAVALINSGADVLYACENGNTALYLSTYYGSLEVSTMLIDRGAVINMQDSTLLWTPLHCAVSQGHLEVALMLIERGADTELRNKYGKTALEMNPALTARLEEAIAAYSTEFVLK